MFAYERFGAIPQVLKAGDESIISKLRNKAIMPYQCYNTHLSGSDSNWIRVREDFKYNKSQGKTLNKTYYDIETYVRVDNTLTPFTAQYAYYPVNACAYYNNIKNTAIIPFLRHPNHSIYTDAQLTELVNVGYQEICKNEPGYLVEDMHLEVKGFNTELELLTFVFNSYKELNHHILMGFNSQNFDDPYIIKRLKKLNEGQWENLISEFGQVKSFGELSFEFPDYNLVDLLVMYKPVDVGGDGFGKSLPDYTLNTICKNVLELTKLDLDEDFIHSYENNIVNYLLYNLLDVLLVFKLDTKLKFIEQVFALAEINSAPLGATIRGRSLMFSARNNIHFTKEGRILRHGKFSSEVVFKID